MRLNAIIADLNDAVDDETMYAAAYAYAYLIARGDVEGDLGFELPDATASIEELTEGFEQYLDADEELFQAVMDATGLTAADDTEKND